jgi:hypothetical protein
MSAYRPIASALSPAPDAAGIPGERPTLTRSGPLQYGPTARYKWISPVARALLKAREGDLVTVGTPPHGPEEIEVLEISCQGSNG